MDSDPNSEDSSIKSLSIPQTGRIRLQRHDTTGSIDSQYDFDGLRVSLHNKFGKRGHGNGHLQNATGVAHLYNGTVIVSDMILSRISFFGKSGRYQKHFNTGHASEPWNCDILPNGHIVCTLGHDKCVAVYSYEGEALRKFGEKYLVQPKGVACDKNGNVIVTDTFVNDVFIFDSFGMLVDRLSLINKNISFNQPRYVTVTNSGLIAVLDSGNHCIHMFSADRKFIRRFCKYGREDGELRFPYGITSDTDGNFYVADHYNNRVSMFTSSGEFVRHVVASDMKIRRPQGISIHKTFLGNTLYITHGELKAQEVVAYHLCNGSHDLSIGINAFV